ncbi:spermine oxidase-like [Colletes gigas]|uniref:spermine oxidase-like n=1 Tax=Colletes gigas TaxID=935657 RepID=UPI001C9B156D|nr:spermine oxidase-like [Colletes gigas]XP_043265923.1 spermine oxidase-like [Colletes gigas]
MFSTAILFLFCLMKNTIHVDAGSPRIVIVGAGASGIAAASKLLENGFDNVLILEAEDRIGGRVNTVKFDEYVVDLGAQWIHGEKGNVAYQLAAPLNVTDHSDPYYDEIYTKSGQLLDSEIMSNVTEFFIQLLESIDTTEDCNNTASMGECFEKKSKQHFALFPELNDTMQEELLWRLHMMETSLDPADSWYDLSLLDYAYMGCEGDKTINWKERGYSTILDILMKKFPNPEEELPVLNNTIVKAEVTKVDYSSENGSTVKLTTLDGNEYIADHVIMTPSLGVLKAQYETLFHPQLPESKIKNIKGLGFGNACKIILAFNDTWFNDRGMKNRGFSFLWSEAERMELDADPKTRWLPYTMGAYVVEHKPRLLLLWISGKGGRLMDDLTDDQVLEQTVSMLENFLGKEYKVARPTAMIRSKWHENKHFRGTYSYQSIETVRRNTSAKQLAEPIMKMGKPVILFAGEATNEYHFSTVHGAIGSGWREAERLIKLYDENDSRTERN